jgi:hypothetical protein
VQVLSLRKNVVIDSLAGSNGNNNGWVDLGETVGFVDTLYNGSAAGVVNVTATLRSTDPDVRFADSLASFGDIPIGALANNGTDPFRLVCYGTPRAVTFTLHLEGVLDNRPYSDDLQFPVRAGLKMGEVIKVISPVYSSPDTNIIYGLAYDGTNLRVSDWGRPRIYKVDPNSGDTVVGSIPAPTATQMTDLAWDWGDNTLWAHSVASRQVYKLDPANGTVMRQFPTPAQNYPIGLELRGGGRVFPADTLWLVGRGTAPADSKAFYKCDTLGNLFQILPAPPFVAVPYGPRCLAWEPAGQPYWNGGTLLLAVTDFSAPGPDLMAAHVYELRQVGANMDSVPVLNHHFICGWNLRAIERDTTDWNYWISEYITSSRSNIYKIKGFYDKPLPPSGVEAGPVALPTAFALGQNYPNPMTGCATIRYQLPKDIGVSLKVYNLAGQLVKTLVSGPEKAGYKGVAWDGRSERGKKVGAGVYFYRLLAGEFTATRKMVVVR